MDNVKPVEIEGIESIVDESLVSGGKGDTCLDLLYSKANWEQIIEEYSK